MGQHSDRRRDLVRLWCCFIISTVSISCLLGSVGDKVVVVPNNKIDGILRRHGNTRGWKTVVPCDEQGGEHQPCTLGGKHDL